MCDLIFPERGHCNICDEWFSGERMIKSLKDELGRDWIEISDRLWSDAQFTEYWEGIPIYVKYRRE